MQISKREMSEGTLTDAHREVPFVIYYLVMRGVCRSALNFNSNTVLRGNSIETVTLRNA